MVAEVGEELERLYMRPERCMPIELHRPFDADQSLAGMLQGYKVGMKKSSCNFARDCSSLLCYTVVAREKTVGGCRLVGWWEGSDTVAGNRYSQQSDLTFEQAMFDARQKTDRCCSGLRHCWIPCAKTLPQYLSSLEDLRELLRRRLGQNLVFDELYGSVEAIESHRSHIDHVAIARDDCGDRNKADHSADSSPCLHWSGEEEQYTDKVCRDGDMVSIDSVQLLEGFPASSLKEVAVALRLSSPGLEMHHSPLR